MKAVMHTPRFSRPTLSVIGVGLAAAFSLAVPLLSAQIGGSSPTYPAVPGRPALVMPTAGQREAIAAFHAAVDARMMDVIAARQALLQTSLSTPAVGVAAIREKATALAAAERALATAQGDALA